VGNTLNLTDTAVVNAQPYRTNNQFTSINIAGSLIVPSGTVLRAMGDVTVTGTITVATGADDTIQGPPVPGIARGIPGTYYGGIGISLLSAARLTRPGPIAGGSGEVKNTNGTAGAGGGALVIAAQGSVTIPAGGSIVANGGSGTTSGTAADIGGPGGGGGGIIVIAARGNLTIGGVVRANGGAGGNAINTNGGTTGAGGGGGGGGGIVHLISINSSSITGTVQANGGAAGADLLVTPVGSNVAGDGGGASGGNGGNGGGGPAFTGPASAAQAGSAGYVIQLVTPSPENLL
jgi:hypothetical protein